MSQAVMSGEFAGALREPVTIERRDAARDALGGAAGSWTAIGVGWAAVTPDARGAAVAGDAVAGLPLWRIMLRAPCAATIGDRLRWRTRRLTVRWREDDPRAPDRVQLVAEEAR